MSTLLLIILCTASLYTLALARVIHLQGGGNDSRTGRSNAGGPSPSVAVADHPATLSRLNPNLFFAVVVYVFAVATAARASASEIPKDYADRLVRAIYIAEGGAKTRHPYGVLSVTVRSASEARRIATNSVRNNWRRWESSGRPGGFVEFMAARWCPASTDPVGHRNWVKNVEKLSR